MHVRGGIAFIILSVSLSSASLSGQTIRTVAGGGIDDGLPGTAVSLSLLPHGLGVDSKGQVYVSDNERTRIRRLRSDGVVDTYAGIGVMGTAGDGGPSDEAALMFPGAMVFDANDNLYFCDPGHPRRTSPAGQRIRRIDGKTRQITLVAGGGLSLDEDIPATDAFLSTHGIAIDKDGAIYVNDRDRSRIRRIDPITGRIRTILGTGNAGYNGDGAGTSTMLNEPQGIAIDPSSRFLYVADRLNVRVRRLELATGLVTNVAGNGTPGFEGDNGPLAAAQLSYPFDVSFDHEGKLWILEWALIPGSAGDFRLGRVRVVRDGIISTVISGLNYGPMGDDGPAFDAVLEYPNSLAFDPADNLYVVDSFHQRVRRVDHATRRITTVIGGSRVRGDGGDARAAIIDSPAGLTHDPSGNFYVTESESFSIRRIDGSGTIDTFTDGLYPSSVAADDQYIYSFGGFGDSTVLKRKRLSTGEVEVIGGGGTGSGDSGPATAARFSFPGQGGLAIHRPSSSIYLTTRNAVFRVDSQTLQISRVAGNGTRGFGGDNGPATSAMLAPEGVAVDADNTLYIADNGNQRIRAVSNGVITTFAGGGSDESEGVPALQARLENVIHLRVDATGNLLYSEDFRVRRIDRGTRIVRTIIGNDSGLFSGDHGPAIEAGIAPRGISVGQDGTLHVCDAWSGRVRAVPPCGPIGTPQLLSPAAGVTGLDYPLTFSWSAANNATTYDIYLGSSTGELSLLAANIASTSYVVGYLPSVPAGEDYTWKVVAKADPYCETLVASSATQKFKTRVDCVEPPSFSLLQPVEGAQNVSTSQLLFSWSAAGRVGSYDVHLGTTNPPPYYRSTPEPNIAIGGLRPGATYYWQVVAHAECDASRTVTTPVSAFQTEGACPTVLPFELRSPIGGASVTEEDVLLSWAPADGAASYDLYLGTSPDPPLQFGGLTRLSVVASGLARGETYFWRVVASSSCARAGQSTQLETFLLPRNCDDPGGAQLGEMPDGVSQGQTYGLTIVGTSALSRDDRFRVERSTDPQFTTPEVQDTVSLEATFVAAEEVTYYHRVSLVRCGVAGPTSAVRSLSVQPASSNVLFTVLPRAIHVPLGANLSEHASSFSVENVGQQPIDVQLIPIYVEGVPFFSIADLVTGPVSRVTLAPGTPRKFLILFGGPSTAQAASFSGSVRLQPAGGGALASAYISLRVGTTPGGVPSFEVAGTNTSIASFTPYPRELDDSLRPPLTIAIRNIGSATMHLAGEIGPDAWLVPEQGWDAPIPPGGVRSVTLRTRRDSVPSTLAFPRATYFSVRTADGATDRILVQDHAAPFVLSGRGIASGHTSVVPLSTLAFAPGERRFAGRVVLTNLANTDRRVALVFTESTAIDGFDKARVKNTVVDIRAGDSVAISDFARLFDTDGMNGFLHVVEPYETRTVSVRAELLDVVAGEALYSMPVPFDKEGATNGESQFISGVPIIASASASVVLVETSGLDSVTVDVKLGDGSTPSRRVTVGRFSRQIVDLKELAEGELDAARVSVTTVDGGGSVVALVESVATDRSAGTMLAPDLPESSSNARAETTATSLAAVLPSVLNGPIGTTNIPVAIYRTAVRFVAGISGAKFDLTLLYGSGVQRTFTLILGPGQSFEAPNVVSDLFGLPAGISLAGAIQVVVAQGQGTVQARLFSSAVTGGSFGVVLPVYASGGGSFAGESNRRLLYMDGLDRASAPSRGSDWSLGLSELVGAPVTLVVRLYDGDARRNLIGKRTYRLGPFEQLTINDVFEDAGLATFERNRDYKNVLCVVDTIKDGGMIGAWMRSTSRTTGRVTPYILGPTGGLPVTGALAQQLTPKPPPLRSRPVRRGR